MIEDKASYSISCADLKRAREMDIDRLMEIAGSGDQYVMMLRAENGTVKPYRPTEQDKNRALRTADNLRRVWGL